MKSIINKPIVWLVILTTLTLWIGPVPDAFGKDKKSKPKSSHGGSVKQTKKSSTTKTTKKDVNVDKSKNVNVNKNRDVNVNTRRDVDVDVDRRRDVDIDIEGGHGEWHERGEWHYDWEAGERYEDYEGWKIAAGVTTGIVIGTMLARPPAQSTVVVVGTTNYQYYDNAFYEPIYQGGELVYAVVPPPAGAIITTLPAGCTVTVVGGVSYQSCGGYYYQRVSNGYRVVVIN